MAAKLARPMPMIAVPRALKPLVAACNAPAMEKFLAIFITARPAFPAWVAILLAAETTVWRVWLMVAAALVFNPLKAAWVDVIPPVTPLFMLWPICAQVIALNWLYVSIADWPILR